MTALAAFFDSYYRLRPVNATFTGVHDYDDRLPDWSPDGLAAAADEMRRVRDSLAARRRMEANPSLRADTWVGPYGETTDAVGPDSETTDAVDPDNETSRRGGPTCPPVP